MHDLTDVLHEIVDDIPSSKTKSIIPTTIAMYKTRMKTEVVQLQKDSEQTDNSHQRERHQVRTSTCMLPTIDKVVVQRYRLKLFTLTRML